MIMITNSLKEGLSKLKEKGKEKEINSKGNTWKHLFATTSKC